MSVLRWWREARDRAGMHSRRRPWCLATVGLHSGMESTLPFFCFRTRELAQAEASRMNAHTIGEVRWEVRHCP